jgi:hypothetical protein
MLRKMWTAMCLTELLLGLGAAVAQEDETVSYIIDNTGNRHEGSVEKKGAAGDLLYKKDPGSPTSRTFNKGTYNRVYTPKPAAVATLEKLFSAKKYDDVIAKAPAALSAYDWLGWGGRICYLQGKAHLAKGKVQIGRAHV